MRWWTVLGSVLALVVCNGPMLVFTFGVFLKPVSQEFGWNRGETSAATGMAGLMMAVATPFVGMLVDRCGVRRILLPVIFLSSLSMAAIALARSSVLSFIALYAIAGLAMAGQGPQPYAKAIAQWFDRRRGLAVGIAMSGVGLGIILVPQLARFLIETFGWRPAYVGLGVVLFVVAFPAVAILVREPKGGTERLPPVQKDVAEPARFGLLAAPVFLVAMAVNGTIVHVVPLLTDRGLSPAAAASMLGAVGVASIAGRLAWGCLADRFFAPQVAAGFFLLAGVGIYLVMIESAHSLVLVGLTTLGLALGCEIDMMAFLTTRYFGLRRFAELYGYLFAVFSGGAALGAYLMGVAYDGFHSYNPMLSSFIVVLLIAGVLVLRLGGYTFPAAAKAVRA